MLVRYREHVTPALLAAITTAALIAAVPAYLLTHEGPSWAAALLAGPAVFVWVTRRHGNGLLLAVAVILIVPHWYAHVWLIAPSVAALDLVVGLAHTRVRFVD